MSQSPFTQLTALGVHKSNLLEARMIVTPYNQHVRLLSSEPFGWFAPPKSTRPTGADIVMESLRSYKITAVISGRSGSWGFSCRAYLPTPGHRRESSPCPVE